MSVAEVLARRMQTQRLVGPPAGSVDEVITDLVCTQSQEHAHALWSVALRMGGGPGSGADDLRAAFDRGDFLRTHVLRPTWHVVAPRDLGWILRLTAPRVHVRNASPYKRHALDPDLRARAAMIMVDDVASHGPRTRPQLAAALARAGVPASGDRLAHLVMHAEQEQLLVSGPMSGAQHTYARFTDRVPRTDEPADPEAELVRRFFSGHGPAGLDDFVRWSSSTKTRARAALERVGSRLAPAVVGDHELWYDPARPYDAALHDDRTAWLLPLFDELTLSYPKINFPVADGHPHPQDGDLFLGSVLLGRRNVGIWKRTVTGQKVSVETWLAPGLGRAERAAVADAEDRLVAHLALRRADPGTRGAGSQ
jgi:hypothetical protein